MMFKPNKTLDDQQMPDVLIRLSCSGIFFSGSNLNFKHPAPFLAPGTPPPLTSSGNIRGVLTAGQPAGGQSSCAWKPDRVPLTQNLKYQHQRSIAAACYLLSSTVCHPGGVDTRLICSRGSLTALTEREMLP